MINFHNIFETKWIYDFLIKRNLLRQYKKSKSYILAWIYWKTDIKLREPKEKWVWSFRINKQYRAFWKYDNWDLIIYMIDNHQN